LLLGILGVLKLEKIQIKFDFTKIIENHAKAIFFELIFESDKSITKIYVSQDVFGYNEDFIYSKSAYS